MSFLDCGGNTYNKYAFEGPYLECGRIDVFKQWKDNVNEKKGKDYVAMLRDQYDVPLH